MNRDRFETAHSASSVLGKAFHAAMETYCGGSEVLIPQNETEAIEYGMRAGMKYLADYPDGFIRYSTTIANKQALFDKFTFLYQSYLKEKPYDTGEEILLMEDPLEYTIDVEWRGERLTLPIPLKAYPDKIVRDKKGRIVIKDYKTTTSFTESDKIDGGKIIQAVTEYLLWYAHSGEAPYSMVYEEVKHSKNKDGGPQVREYEMVFAENEQYFDFFFRIYTDVIRALSGEAVFVPNVSALYDNEVAMIAYIHRLDVEAEAAKLMKKHRVSNITDLLKKKIQSAGSMRKLMKQVEKQFISANNLNYEKMTDPEKIQTKMLEHGMMLQFDSKIEGPSVDLFRYTPSIGLKMARIASYVADVEQVLGRSGIRVLAPIPGTTFVGFEVPRKNRRFPNLPTGGKSFDLAIGETIEGDVRRFDIRDAPHLLVAGATGSGKSVFMHAMIQQILRIPHTELYLFDPKQVEFAEYADSRKVKKYLTEPMDISSALTDLCAEMKERYTALKAAKVKNISQLEGMSYKFVVVDEFASLMMRAHVQDALQKIAQEGRAAGIHLIVATQRPSVDIIRGTAKANFPTKVVFRTAKAVDSKVVLDEAGAEKLLGKGDMIFATDAGQERLQGYNV